MSLLCVVVTFLGLLGQTCGSSPFIGYDCSSQQTAMNTVSLIDVKPCNVTPNPVYQSDQRALVVQTRSSESIPVSRVVIQLHSTIKRCGDFHHQYDVHVPTPNRIIELTPEQILRLSTSHELTLSEIPKAVFRHLRPNTHKQFIHQLGGWISPDGYCGGTSTIIYDHEVYPKSVGYVDITFTWTTGIATWYPQENKVVLPGGVSCGYNNGQCFDGLSGHFFWLFGNQTCLSHRPTTVYKGFVTISESKDLKVLSVNETSTFFSTRILNEVSLCGEKFYATDHERVFVNLDPAGVEYPFPDRTTADMDLSLYISSKSLTLSYALHKDLQRMHDGIQIELCRLEENLLRNQLMILRSHPNNVDLLPSGEKGHFAKSAGEALYLFRCPAVGVTLRQDDLCYEDIPITYNNLSIFMRPSTHLIIPSSNAIPCSTITPFMVNIAGLWFQLNPRISRIEAPQLLETSSGFHIELRPLYELAKAGIYPDSDIEQLQRQLMYPSIRQATLNDISRAVLGDGPALHDLSKAFSDDTYENVHASVLLNMWGFLSGLGQAVSGFVGLFFLWICLRTLLAVCVRGKSLWDAGVHSWRLLAACFSCTTHFVLGKELMSFFTQTDSTQQEEPIAMTSVSPPQRTRVYPALEQSILPPCDEPESSGQGAHV